MFLSNVESSRAFSATDQSWLFNESKILHSYKIDETKYG